MLIASKRLKALTSHLARILPGKVPTWPLKNFFEKGAWPGSRDPINFWVLNANSSKTTIDTNFEFGTHAPRKSPVMTPEYFFEKGAWPGSRDPANFWVLNANSSKMTKDMNFKFGVHAPRESPDMTPEFFFRKGGVARVTWPRKFLGVKR